jgi:hypothetical protein
MYNNIDMINNVIFNAGSRGLDANKVPEPAKTLPADSSDATVRSEYSSIINRSLETEEVDLKAIQDAQNAIQEGSLDTPDNIRATAEYILKYGV